MGEMACRNITHGGAREISLKTIQEAIDRVLPTEIRIYARTGFTRPYVYYLELKALYPLSLAVGCQARKVK